MTGEGRGQTPEPGEWVSVLGQVTLEQHRQHPEDIVVEFFSHNEQFDAVVRRDRVARVDPPAGIAARCSHMRASDLDQFGYFRCKRHAGHGGGHQSPHYEWQDRDTDGYLEDR